MRLTFLFFIKILNKGIPVKLIPISKAVISPHAENIAIIRTTRIKNISILLFSFISFLF